MFFYYGKLLCETKLKGRDNVNSMECELEMGVNYLAELEI